jgi:hypothetical protein
LRSHGNKLNRARNTRPKAIALVAILFQMAGTTAVCIAVFVVLVSVSFQAAAPGPEGTPGSGIIVRTEVTALWIPRALRDIAQGFSRWSSPPSLPVSGSRRSALLKWE